MRSTNSSGGVVGQEVLFSDLAGEYFGQKPTPLQATAILLRLSGATATFIGAVTAASPRHRDRDRSR